MAISVDWQTQIISIPQADLTFVGGSIYSVDVRDVHQWLREAEATEDGMAFDPTHNYNLEVVLGGLTFAAVLEMINGYTITWEDGQYAINIVGANSNLGDVSNVNQVSVRPQNSAGLISTPLIEVASFENGVSWDPANDTGKATADAAEQLAGSRNKPLINLDDVETVAAFRKFNTIYVLSDENNLTSGAFDRFVFHGQTHVNNSLDISPAAEVASCVFVDLHVSGTLDGGNELRDCVVHDLIYVNGHIHRCGLLGTIMLGGGSDAVMTDCSTIQSADLPVIDMGGSGQNLAMPNYSGIITITNMSGPQFVGIGVDAGQVKLASTVTNGFVQVSGIGRLVDESGNDITTGTWNGGVTVFNDMVGSATIADALDSVISTDMDFMRAIEGGKQEVVADGGGTLVCYDEDNADEVARFALFDENGARTSDVTQIVSRERLYTGGVTLTFDPYTGLSDETIELTDENDLTATWFSNGNDAVIQPYGTAETTTAGAEGWVAPTAASGTVYLQMLHTPTIAANATGVSLYNVQEV